MFEGASIVSVIARPDHDPSTRVALHHGPELLVGELTLTHELAKPLGVVSEVRHLRIGADGQLGGYLGPVARYRTEIGDIGGGWTILRGQGSKVDAHADWNGDDGGSNQLWDTEDTRTDGGGLGLDGRSSYGVRYQVESPAPASQVITDCVAVTLHAAVFQ